MPPFSPGAKYKLITQFQETRSLWPSAINSPRHVRQSSNSYFWPDLFPHLLAAPSSLGGGEVTAEFRTGGSNGSWEHSKAVPESGETHPGVAPDSGAKHGPTPQDQWVLPVPRAATQNPQSFITQRRCWHWLS